MRHSLINKGLLKTLKIHDHYQFERSGYYAVDQDSNLNLHNIVFNLTIDLGDKNNKKNI